MAPRCRGNRVVRLRRAAIRCRPHQARGTGEDTPRRAQPLPTSRGTKAVLPSLLPVRPQPQGALDRRCGCGSSLAPSSSAAVTGVGKSWRGEPTAGLCFLIPRFLFCFLNRLHELYTNQKYQIQHMSHKTVLHLYRPIAVFCSFVYS